METKRVLPAVNAQQLRIAAPVTYPRYLSVNSDRPNRAKRRQRFPRRNTVPIVAAQRQSEQAKLQAKVQSNARNWEAKRLGELR